MLDALEDIEARVELPVLRTLGRTLRSADWQVTAVVVDDLLIDVEPGDTTERRHGIAFDLGTTTVVATLLDLATGTPLAVASMLNRQQPFGADVISRISATMLDDTALDRLQQPRARDARPAGAGGLRAGRRRAARGVRGRARRQRDDDALALGVDPEPVGVAPFIMASRDYADLRAADLGWPCTRSARAPCSPRSARTSAATSSPACSRPAWTATSALRLFIDVGTNCEIATRRQ